MHLTFMEAAAWVLVLLELIFFSYAFLIHYDSGFLLLSSCIMRWEKRDKDVAGQMEEEICDEADARARPERDKRFLSCFARKLFSFNC